MTQFQDRQNWDLAAWPEMYDELKVLQARIFLSPPGIGLNMMVFTVSSQASGCRHCQAHGAYGLHGLGIELPKIQALWNFDTSVLFDDRERAALHFALAAGSCPNAVQPEHHAALREHFTDEEARTLLGVVALGGFMNRYNDSLATVTDAESADWAAHNLGPIGWDIGKHVGAAHEQRTGPRDADRMGNEQAGHDDAERPEHHHHEPGHGHHGHENDQGIKGALRYLRWLPQMWRSAINDAVVDLIGPKAGERVIDIGAGMGAGAMRAARTGAEVVAVEPTPFMRRVLQVRRIFSRRRTNVEVSEGAAERIPVDDRSIDAIWAVNTMHHWLDVERGVAEISRVLRPGGRILLVDEVFTDPSHPDHQRFGADHDDEHHGFTMIDADQMGGLLRAAGLTEVEASKTHIAGRPVIRVEGHRSPAA